MRRHHRRHLTSLPLPPFQFILIFSTFDRRECRRRAPPQSSPLCRSPLPPGPEKLFELGYRVWAKPNRAVVGGEYDGTWRELSASQQDEMDGAIVML